MPNIDPLPNLPPTLLSYQFSGPQIVKGGIKKTVYLIKCPPVNPNPEIDDQDAHKEWRKWWSRTQWALTPGNNIPRWDSPSRSGQIWNHFGEAAQSTNGHPFVYCLRCSLILQHPHIKSIGTKHMSNHLETQQCQQISSYIHVQSPTQIARVQQQQSEPRHTRSIIPPFSTQYFEQELVHTIVDNNWSFRTVERPSFHRFIRFLRPGTSIPSRTKFLHIFQNQFEIIKKSLLSDLEPTTKISIALDGWSANNHLSFLAIKCYYINKSWQLKEVLLDFIPIRGKHTGSSMAAELLQLLSSTNTERQLLAITADNASNNTTLRIAVEKALQEKEILWNAKENTIPCLAHVINLVVQDIISHLQLTDPDSDGAQDLQRCHIQGIQSSISIPNSLRKLRAICIAIDQSPQRFERFIALQQHLPACERLSVIRDVKTRWNSTFDMCERAIKLQEFINQWLQQEIAIRMLPTSQSNNNSDIDFRDLKRLRLDLNEWHHLQCITEMLRKFKDATTWLSQNQEPQIQYIWLMYNRLFDFLDDMIEDLEEDTDTATWPEIVRAAATRGRNKLTKYYRNTDQEQGFLFNCATILDPTQKLTVYEDDTWDPLDKFTYREQFLQYLDRYDNQDSNPRVPLVNNPPRRLQGTEWFRRPTNPSPSRLGSQSSLLSSSSQSQEILSQEDEQPIGATRREGEIYLSSPILLERKGFDILKWWKKHQDTYPRLSQVARDILSIPIANVGVERVFNTARDVIGDRRHRLRAQTIRQILILKYAITQEEVKDLNAEQALANEMDDLLDLPAQTGVENSVEDEVIQDNEIEEEVGEEENGEDNNDVEEIVQLSRRKRRRRYCDN